MSRSHYGQILKASILTGGAQVVTLLAGFVRMKLAAVLLGPNGVGIIGLYTQATGMLSAITGLGLGSSAVGEVAAAEGAGDREKLGRVVRSLRVLVQLTGLLAALLCLLLATPLSQWTFGDESHRNGFLALSLALFLSQLAAGQAALLRGLGRIRELAIQSVAVSLASTATAVTCYWIWGEKGIVPSLMALAALTLLGAWWYERNIKLPEITLSWREALAEARGMLRMGVAFLWSAVINLGVAYAIGVMVRTELGLAGNGLYLAAWGISGMFVGFVLSAMGQDFYPRLTALIRKPKEACALINEQTEIGILLALPGVVGTIAMSDWIITLLFSRDFLPASGAVVGFALGCFGRITSFPLGYALIAQGDSRRFALTETIFGLLNLALAWGGLRRWGLPGVAAGFALMYLAYSVTMRFVIGRALGFRYNRSSLSLIFVSLAFLAIAALAGPWTGIPLTLSAGLLSLRAITGRMGPDHPLSQKLHALPGARLLLGNANQSSPKTPPLP